MPPPELVARETVEVVRSDRRVTPKRWESTWYADRFERSEESVGECERQLPSEVSRSIEELVRTEGVTSVPAVLGRLGIDPAHREAVASMVADT